MAIDIGIESQMEDTRAFYYGMEDTEVNELSDPFYILSELEEEMGMPLAFIT